MKRCPSGTRRNKQTGLCQKKKLNNQSKTKKIKMTDHNEIYSGILNYQLKYLSNRIKEQKTEITNLPNQEQRLVKTNNKSYHSQIENLSHENYLAYLRIISQREANRIPPNKLEKFWKEQNAGWDYQPHNTLVDVQILLKLLKTYPRKKLYKLNEGNELSAIQLVHRTLPQNTL